MPETFSRVIFSVVLRDNVSRVREGFTLISLLLVLRVNPYVNLKIITKVVRKEILGGYGGGVPPLPIPNREVKPTSADGTAMQCGRVGNRLL